MKPSPFRSDCPINASLEIFGDKWSMLIIRDLIYFGKTSFSQFLASDEQIARNILADRLKQLQDNELILKKPHPSDARKDRYELTASGLDLIPVLLALAVWGKSKVPSDEYLERWYRLVQEGGESLVHTIRSTLENGGSVFIDSEGGYPSVIRQRGLLS